MFIIKYKRKHLKQIQYLFENFCKSINYEKGKNLNDLYLLLKQKSKYIGNLFDKKLK